MSTHRGSGLWIMGRIGILVCFGILPMMRSCERVRTAPLRETWKQSREYADKTFDAFDEMYRHPVNSEAWNSNFVVAQCWLSNQSVSVSNGHFLYQKFYGKP